MNCSMSLAGRGIPAGLKIEIVPIATRTNVLFMFADPMSVCVCAYIYIYIYIWLLVFVSCTWTVLVC